jgi:hypothetical protein
MATASSLGTFVNTSYVLSTALNNRWAYLAAIYQRWRIKYIRFHYRSQIGTSNNGRVAMAVVEDADGSAPTTFPGLMEQRCSSENSGRSSFNMTYRPIHEDWLWTRDLTLNEDRLEYPGVLNVATGSFTVASVPGYIWYEYLVEFSAPCNSETQLARARALGLTFAPDPVKTSTSKEESSPPVDQQVVQDTVVSADDNTLSEKLDAIIALLSATALK